MSIADLALGVAAAAALVIPGWFAARAARLPQPLLAGFIGGSVALTALVLGLTSLRAPLTLATVGGAWLIGGGTAAFGLAVRAKEQTVAAPAPPAGRENWPLLLPLLPVGLVVAYRAVVQPLFGVDTIFRWNYLAEQMLTRGTLAFYPPADAAGYAIYAWPDGIAPVVSTLYFWAYALAGEARPALTAPVVLLQFALVLAGVHALARRTFSGRAAWFATALAACFPMVGWATAMGQETGLTAIATLGLLLYLPRTRAEETTGAVVCAGLAAALGALAREYGLVLPLLGLGLCVGRRLSPRACGWFLVIAALGAAPWYVRNWALTGNPLFNLAVGNVFPVSDIHVWLNASYQAEHGWSQLPPEAPRLLFTHGLLPLAAAIAGLVVAFRAGRTLALTAAVFVAIWAASISYTAAGFIYSLRVLNPALALSAVLGGAALAAWIPDHRRFRAVVIALALLATDAAVRTIVLPANVYRLPPSEWLNAGRALHDYHARPIYRELARVAGAERMLVFGPNALLNRQGAQTLPLWSPEVRFVFNNALPPPEIARRLRAAGIGYVVLNTGAANESFLARSAFFRDPAGALQRVWSDADMVLLRVNTAMP